MTGRRQRSEFFKPIDAQATNTKADCPLGGRSIASASLKSVLSRGFQRKRNELRTPAYLRRPSPPEGPQAVFQELLGLFHPALTRSTRHESTNAERNDKTNRTEDGNRNGKGGVGRSLTRNKSRVRWGHKQKQTRWICWKAACYASTSLQKEKKKTGGKPGIERILVNMSRTRRENHPSPSGGSAQLTSIERLV